MGQIVFLNYREMNLLQNTKTYNKGDNYDDEPSFRY